MTAKNKCTHKITIKICTMSELTLVTFLHMLLALCKCKKWRISDVIFFLSKSTIQINQVIKQNVVHISMSKSDNKFLFFNNRNALRPGQDAKISLHLLKMYRLLQNKHLCNQKPPSSKLEVCFNLTYNSFPTLSNSILQTEMRLKFLDSFNLCVYL